LLIVASTAGVLCSGCDRSSEREGEQGQPAATSALKPVALPDLARMDESVKSQARARYAAATEHATASPAERAVGFGELGMLLHAAEFYDAAEPCYLNAQTLAPDDVRWPYYLGHLYKSRGQTPKAEAAFTRALELRPDDVPTLVWLGRMYLDGGQPERAEPFFRRAKAQAPRTVAVVAGLGQTALALRDYQTAVSQFEEALAIDPTMKSVHSPLAAAYRGLGRIDEAEAQLRQWRNTELLVPDPLKMELDVLLQSGLSYELRGVRALESGDPKAAAAFFRQGIPLTAEKSAMRRSLNHKLGTALYLTGDPRGAIEQFETVVREAPLDGVDESSAKAHYSLGLVMATNGQGRQAIEHLYAAVKYQPSYAEARLALGDMLRASGRFEASLPQYVETVRLNPRSAEARFGYAIALVRLKRYRDARDWLTESVRMQPDHPELAHALARVLAAAPDAGVRDGRRAIAIVEELLKRDKSTELGATMAMTLAEVGDFDQAASIQRGVIEASQRAGLNDAVRRLTDDLRLYERRQPCRTPWKDDDPVNLPGTATANSQTN
jgi:tetratricopeptide (TPR) repeat protein